MPRLTEEQKRQNRHDSMLANFDGKSIGKCVEATAKKLQEMVRVVAARLGDEYCRCCSCGKWHHYKTMHGGHWIDRQKRATVLADPQVGYPTPNVHPQCVYCNKFNGGGTAKQGYDDFMLKTYGKKRVNALLKLSGTHKQWTKDELVSLRIQFMDRIKKAKGER